MCGIVGYIGKKEKKDFLLKGLKELEYRGYDSSGFAVIKNGEIDFFKCAGRLNNLVNKTKNFTSDGLGIGIAHTRWATHGKPNDTNAHPHWGEKSFIIHNGIIENYKEIKEKLSHIHFISQTDTEVIVHLFEYYIKLKLTPKDAFKQTIKDLKGAYAILLITKHEPNTVFFAKNSVPLMIGRNEDEIYFSSSDSPLVGYAQNAIYLDDKEYGYASFGKIEIFKDENPINIAYKPIPKNKISAQKEGYDYFMQKEIYEQGAVLSETLMGRVKDDDIAFDELESDFFNGIENITICACGTSFHAGLSSAYLLERIAKIPTKVEIASEFRYKEPILNTNTLFIVISQSGETADTLEALKIAKKAKLKTLAICNVDNSSIVRESMASILTRAGIEKGVASTKAFATQVAVLWMLAIKLCKNHEIKQEEIKTILKIPSILKVNDKLHDKIHRLSKRYLHGHGFFYIGRDLFYPLALEGALKLKEISYLHAEGYAAGEMKHGPIALADSRLFTIALMPKNLLFDKIKSNVEELSARDSTILAISPNEIEVADDFIKTSYDNHVMFEFYEMMLIVQLLALEIALRLNLDVDMPRNLAKSVTVE